MIVWVSKKALRVGLYMAEVEDTDDPVVSLTNGRCLHRKEWHRTREEAVARAEELRQRKITSLKVQLRKMEKMVF